MRVVTFVRPSRTKPFFHATNPFLAKELDACRMEPRSFPPIFRFGSTK